MTTLTQHPSAESQIAALMARAASHRQAGRAQEALALVDRALALTPNHREALVHRCRLLLDLGRIEEVLPAVWRALDQGVDLETIGTDAASALIRQNRLIEARATLEGVLRRAPGNAQAWGMIGEISHLQGKPLAAEACFRRNMRLSPTDTRVRIRLAEWLTQKGRNREALKHLSKARRLSPDNPDAQSGFAQTLIAQGNLNEAEPILRSIIEKHEEHLDARLGLARLLLLRGDLDEGLRAYEWRRRRNDLKLPRLTGPEWDGTPIAGKTLVVYAEQGFGDVIQFLRFIPILASEGARVIVVVPRELNRLCQCLAHVAEITSDLRTLPPFDYHAPLMSIPHLLGVTLDTLPAEPYLSLGDLPRKAIPVPIVWRDNLDGRSATIRKEIWQSRRSDDCRSATATQVLF